MADGDQPSGTIHFLICGSSAPGTYAVRTTGTSQVTHVTDQRRRGFGPTSGAEVLLERKVDGVWTRIRGSRSLTDRGVTRTVVSLPPGTWLRAATMPDGYLAGSGSRSVKLHR